MQTMAQQVLVYRLTGSATALGMVSFIALIPLIPLGLIGGSIIDRFSRRGILIFTQVMLMAQAFLLAALTYTGAIEVWHVYALSLVLGAVNAIDVPARQAFTVDMVEGKEDLTNAIGLNSAMFNGARALGPAMAGLAVAATGESTAFLINGLTFVSVIISLAMMRNLPRLPRPAVKQVHAGSHIFEGLRFVRGRRDMLYLVALVGVSAFLSMPYSTLMPVFAENVLGASARPVVDAVCNTGLLTCQSPEAVPLGALLTVVGIGALIGALVVASLPGSAHRGKLLTLGNLMFPALLLLFALSRSFLASMVILLLIGISFVTQNALANTLIQMVSPDELRGRVMGVYSMVMMSSMRLGGLQAGLVADAFSAPISVGFGALLSMIFGAFVALRVPEVRRLK